jgi:hypothetical protein
MSTQITLKFTVSATDYSVPLGLRVRLDNNIIYENTNVSEESQIQYHMSDDDGEHELTFEMFGKISDHTTIDDSGNIVSDAMLSIFDIEIDEIDVSYIVQTQSVYHHDFNGTRAPVEDKFYDSLGCNGTVKLKFTTPIYLWLLENM